MIELGYKESHSEWSDVECIILEKFPISHYVHGSDDQWMRLLPLKDKSVSHQSTLNDWLHFNKGII